MSNSPIPRSLACELLLLGDLGMVSFSRVDSILSSVILSLGFNRRFKSAGIIFKSPSRQSTTDMDSFSKYAT